MSWSLPVRLICCCIREGRDKASRPTKFSFTFDEKTPHSSSSHTRSLPSDSNSFRRWLSLMAHSLLTDSITHYCFLTQGIHAVFSISPSTTAATTTTWLDSEASHLISHLRGITSRQDDFMQSNDRINTKAEILCFLILVSAFSLLPPTLFTHSHSSIICNHSYRFETCSLRIILRHFGAFAPLFFSASILSNDTMLFWSNVLRSC